MIGVLIRKSWHTRLITCEFDNYNCWTIKLSTWSWWIFSMIEIFLEKTWCYWIIINYAWFTHICNYFLKVWFWNVFLTHIKFCIPRWLDFFLGRLWVRILRDYFSSPWFEKTQRYLCSNIFVSMKSWLIFSLFYVCVDMFDKSIGHKFDKETMTISAHANMEAMTMSARGRRPWPWVHGKESSICSGFGSMSR